MVVVVKGIVIVVIFVMVTVVGILRYLRRLGIVEMGIALAALSAWR